MEGWKTKYGAIAMAIGVALMGAAEVAPTDGVGIWLKFIGTALTGLGSGLGVVGIGHKIEKNKSY